MTGLSRLNFDAFAERFDLSRADTVCDVGGATGLLATLLAKRSPHLKCISFDLPAVAPIAQKAVEREGLSNRITVASGESVWSADVAEYADRVWRCVRFHRRPVPGVVYAGRLSPRRHYSPIGPLQRSDTLQVNYPK